MNYTTNCSRVGWLSGDTHTHQVIPTADTLTTCDTSRDKYEPFLFVSFIFTNWAMLAERRALDNWSILSSRYISLASPLLSIRYSEKKLPCGVGWGGVGCGVVWTPVAGGTGLVPGPVHTRCSSPDCHEQLSRSRPYHQTASVHRSWRSLPERRPHLVETGVGRAQIGIVKLKAVKLTGESGYTPDVD